MRQLALGKICIFLLFSLHSINSFAMHVHHWPDGSVTFETSNSSDPYKPRVNPECERQRQAYLRGHALLSFVREVSTVTYNEMTKTLASVQDSQTHPNTAYNLSIYANSVIQEAERIHNYVFRYGRGGEGSPNQEAYDASSENLKKAKHIYETQIKPIQGQRSNQRIQDYFSIIQNPPKNPCTGCTDPNCNENWAKHITATNKNTICCDSQECTNRFKNIIEKAQPSHPVLTQQQMAEKMRIDSNVSFTTTQKALITAENSNTRSSLSSVPSSQLDPVAATYINDQLDYSETLAGDAIKLATNGGSDAQLKLMTDLATDISNITKDLISGFGAGVSMSVQNLQNVAAAIWQDPTLIGHLYGNTMNYITSAQSLQDLKQAWKTYRAAVKSGDAYAIGKYTGKLAADAAITLAGMKVVNGAALEALERSTLGSQLVEGISAVPAIQAELTAYDSAMADFVNAKFKPQDFEAIVKGNHIDHVVAIRDGYNLDLKNIATEMTKMSLKGETKEQMARTAHQMRRDIGEKYKNLCHPDLRDRIFNRNNGQKGYDELGPSWDALIDKATNDKNLTGDAVHDYIIKSSQKSNSNLNKAVEALKR